MLILYQMKLYVCKYFCTCMCVCMCVNIFRNTVRTVLKQTPIFDKFPARTFCLFISDIRPH